MHPLIIQRVLLPAHEFMLSRPTLAYLRRLERSQWWPLDRLRALQQEKLRRVLIHAAAKCRFHRSRIERAGIDPARMMLDALPALPTLTKSDIRAHAAEMQDPTVRGGLHPYFTGGSTGEPLRFKIDRTRQAADQAARARTRRWFGIDMGERELYLWGAPVELRRQDVWKGLRDRLTNQRLLSAFNMTPRRMSRYLDEVDRFDPVHIFGYPSSLARLAGHARNSARVLANRALRAVFTTGEVMDPADRALLGAFFGVPVADGYGSREAGFIAHQCPEGRYHVTMESLVVELLDAKGDPVRDGTPGEVVVTHLDAYGMPFIRYRTGDFARWSSASCPCGRGLEVLEAIEGRRTDMLMTADGGFAHALSVIYVLREEPGIREFKVVQGSALDLDVAVVAGPDFDERRRRRVREMLRKRIGGQIEVRLNLVDSIEPAPSGKHRCVVSRAG